MPKISELNALTTASANDLIIVAHDISGLPSTRKIKVKDFSNSIASLVATQITYANVIPYANVTYSLGSPNKQWKDLYVSGNTIYIGNFPVSINANGQLAVNGSISTGYTGSAGSLGYTGSVGSTGYVGSTGPSGTVSNGSSNVNITSTNGNIAINANGAYSWTFNTDGQTLFPSQTNERGDINSGTITGYTIKIGDGTSEAIITTPDGNDVYSYSQRLVINPGAGATGTAAEGGDIYLWAGRGGSGGGSGGDVKIRGGYGPSTGGGGYIRIEGGDTTDGTAGFVEIKGGESSTGNGGDVKIYAGFGNAYAGNANVEIYTYSGIGTQQKWSFGNNAVLTLPGLLQAPQATQANDSIGIAGQISWDSNNIYVCVGPDMWKAVALSDF